MSWAKPDSDNALFGKDDLVAVLSRAACGRLCIGSLSLFQEMQADVALHSDLGACENETSAAKSCAL